MAEGARGRGLSKPTHGGDVGQLSLWLPASLLAAVAEQAHAEGLTQRQAVTAALASWVAKGWRRRSGRRRAPEPPGST